MTDFALSAYQVALRAARDSGYALGRTSLQLVEAAFRRAIADLNRLALSDDPMTAERAASMRRQLIAVLERMETTVARATARGVTLTIEDVVAIHRTVTEEVVTRVLGQNVLGISARFDVAAVRAASILASTRPARTFQTLVRRHLLDAAPELDRMLVAGVARGQSSRSLARDIAVLLREGTPLGVDPSSVAGLRTLRSDARRIAVSETNNALREAGAQSLAASPTILAAQWQRSGNHAAAVAKYGPDECDILAETDFYGLGQGFYDPRHWPLAPHPHDACYQGSVKLRPVSEWTAPASPAPALALSPAEMEFPPAWTEAWTDRRQETVRASVAASLGRIPPQRVRAPRPGRAA